MAMKKRYHTVNGMLIGETSNGVRRGYLPDALGSVVATVDDTGSIENTYRYKPYGSLLAKTGTAQDPRFRFTGCSGSRSAALRSAEVYNRARHLSLIEGAWTTVDPYWPTESQYLYVNARPTSAVDPSGLAPQAGGAGCNKCNALCGYSGYIEALNLGLGRFCSNYLGNDSIRQCIDNCAGKTFYPGCIKAFCKQDGVVINCRTGPAEGECEKAFKSTCPSEEKFGCTKRVVMESGPAMTKCVSPGNPVKNKITICCNDPNDFLRDCCCDQKFHYSEDLCKKIIKPPLATVLHELYHVCGANCTPHGVKPPPGGFPHDSFANCVKNCFKPPLW